MFWAAYRVDRRQEVFAAVYGREASGSLGQISSDALDMLNLRDTWGKQCWRQRGRSTAQRGSRRRSRRPDQRRLGVAGERRYEVSGPAVRAQLETAIEPGVDQYAKAACGSIA